MNGKLYIGSTSTRGFSKRFSDHRRLLRINRHENPHLQASWNKHGENAFMFEVLLYCDSEDCLAFEQMALDCYQPEYNINPVAGSRLGATLNEVSRKKIRDANLGKTYSKEINKKKGCSRSKTLSEREKISSSLQKYYAARCHHNSKLTESDVRKIKRLMQRGWRNKELARQFGVTPQTISAIRHGHTWRNINV